MLLIILTTCLALLATMTQLFPGALILLVGMLFWSGVNDIDFFTVYFVIAAAILAAFMLIKYLSAGRYMKRQGISNSSLFIGAIVGIVAFFVIPIVGLFIGFVVGIYLAEFRKDRALAWIRTKTALKGVLMTIMVESLGIIIAAGVWVLAHYQLVA